MHKRALTGLIFAYRLLAFHVGKYTTARLVIAIIFTSQVIAGKTIEAQKSICILEPMRKYLVAFSNVLFLSSLFPEWPIKPRCVKTQDLLVHGVGHDVHFLCSDS